MSNDLPPPDPATLVTLARFDSLPEAAILRGLLESSDIPVRLSDAYTVQGNPLLAGAIGGLRVEVPAGRLAEARQVLSAWQAGQLALDEPDSEPARPPCEPMPRLWQPDWAAVLAVPLGPWFAMLLHYLNWRSLGNVVQARRELHWLSGMLLATAAAVAYAWWGPGEVVALLAMAMLLSLPVLLFWYLARGRAQSRLLLPWPYPRRPMWLAFVLGGLLTATFWFAVELAFRLGVPVDERVAALVHSAGKLPQQVDELTTRIAVRAEGPVLAEVLQVSGIEPDAAMLDAAFRADLWRSCRDGQIAALLARGMIIDVRFVDPAGQPLGGYRIRGEDCQSAR
ncbi:putative signal transducing protein [Chitinilyticum litopenaei]|uniref:putative signal transducing protein n=1 Tax=Chitinilyticum litopenaei TaxID=1121276 RepID=UPI00040156A7|nr:DUF2007 domain-containing protein [Chitinilyticum litopenaei]